MTTVKSTPTSPHHIYEKFITRSSPEVPSRDIDNFTTEGGEVIHNHKPSFEEKIGI